MRARGRSKKQVHKVNVSPNDNNKGDHDQDACRNENDTPLRVLLAGIIYGGGSKEW